jgi:hypothetical protein
MEQLLILASVMFIIGNITYQINKKQESNTLMIITIVLLMVSSSIFTGLVLNSVLNS